MRTISTYILRPVWLLLLFGWIWSLATGTAVQPLHPFNIILTTAVVIGALAIWFSAPPAQILSAICGVVAALMMGFQFLVVMTMFTSDTKVQFRASLGPLEFQGIAAQAVLWVLPLLLLVLSAMLLFNQIQHRISQIPNANPKSESA